jgi:2-methylisocitrate lyase-like PEP mutase family enzyme
VRCTCPAIRTRIVRAVSLPVTVDFERGYGLAPAELVERFAATGAVGLNLEDSDPPTGEMIDAAEQADFLAAVRSAALSAGVDLVINARTDSFLRPVGSQEEQLAASIDRGARYVAAGAGVRPAQRLRAEPEHPAERSELNQSARSARCGPARARIRHQAPALKPSPQNHSSHR